MQEPEKKEDIFLTNEQAIVAILLLSVSADGKIAEQEVSLLNHLFASFKTLKLSSIDYLIEQVLNKGNGEALLEAACKTIPTKLKEPIFAVAVDIILSDNYIHSKEIDFLDQLAEYLGIPNEKASNIIDVLVLKNRL
jgi:uncharacterized tellurite resistance protein B-like protein